ncbi:MAG: DUF3891 family protein, partial [Thermomicrobiaceae bacterium]|nr:DUF3891 family protein [Thermomicrobiaceae bacterium]
AEPDEAVREFLARQEALQAELLASLRADPRYAPWATDEAVARNRRLVAVWDAISLAVCGGLPRGRWIPDVPSSDEPCSLMLAPSRSAPDTIVVDAWPFRVDRLTLTFEGRRLGSATFSDEAELRAALKRAPWVSLAVTLRPA